MAEKNATGTSLSTVIIFTSRMAQLAQFYRDGLGIGPYQESPGHLGCQVGEVYFGFDQVESEITTGERSGASLWFEVDDLEETFERLVGMGAAVRYPPTHKPWGAHLASLMDPDGNLLGLSQRKP